jgi:hypothetical protein
MKTLAIPAWRSPLSGVIFRLEKTVTRRNDEDCSKR